MTRFLLIRHATTDSVHRQLSGRTGGVHLNMEGKLQAKELGERLSSLSISLVCTSPLERAVETATPVAESHGLKPVVVEEFLEVDFGTWTNLSFEELRNEKDFNNFNSFRSCTPAPGGEYMLQAQLRMVTKLQKLSLEHTGKTIAVVSHGDLIRATLAYYAGIHLDLFQRIEISPASVSIVEVYADSARIVLMNHTGEVRG